jgi:hypothetical protein
MRRTTISSGLIRVSVHDGIWRVDTTFKSWAANSAVL